MCPLTAVDLPMTDSFLQRHHTPPSSVQMEALQILATEVFITNISTTIHTATRNNQIFRRESGRLRLLESVVLVVYIRQQRLAQHRTTAIYTKTATRQRQTIFSTFLRTAAARATNQLKVCKTDRPPSWWPKTTINLTNRWVSDQIHFHSSSQGPSYSKDCLDGINCFLSDRWWTVVSSNTLNLFINT